MKMKFRTVKTVMILGFLLLILFTAFNLLHQQSNFIYPAKIIIQRHHKYFLLQIINQIVLDNNTFPKSSVSLIG